MTTLRFRVTGPAASIGRVLDRLSDLEGVTRAEQVADLMAHMDDDDSSSAGLAENEGSDTGALEIEVEDDATAELVRRVADIEASEAGAALELVDRF
jgi:hypothetical protein